MPIWYLQEWTLWPKQWFNDHRRASTQKSLYGLYHVPSKPISKYDLLKLVAENYNCKVKLKKNETIKMNRTLCGTKFFRDTGYTAPTGKKLIYNMKLGKY